MKTIITFLNKGFNKYYSVIERSFTYDNKLYNGYVLRKNYTFLWVKDFNTVEVFLNETELNKYLIEHNITV